jgi:NAD(P)-dependent dehydrogenase (short-subunit alcohol dehydrogenase family)
VQRDAKGRKTYKKMVAHWPHQPDDNPPRRQTADSRLTTYLANAARCENDSPTSSAARRSGAHRPVKRLEGKVAVVTGAGSGIGEATARLMVREGAAVVVADINVAAAERVAGDLPTAVAAEVDVSDEQSVVRMVDTAVQTFGGLDVLHNNASDISTTARDTDVVTLDMEVFDRLVAVNLKGPFLGCKHAIPRMLERGGGPSSTRPRSTASWAAGSALRTERPRPASCS